MRRIHSSRHSRARTALPIRARTARPRRIGTTLTEVLVSLLVMSIGVISLATLFPISMLKSVEANKMTNSKLLALNAEAIIESNPQILTAAPAWLPRTYYAAGSVVTADPPDGRLFFCTRAGQSGMTVPAPYDFPSVLGRTFVEPGGGTPTWALKEAPDPPGGGAIPDASQAYVVDPLGWLAMGGASLPAPQDQLAHWLGNDGLALPPPAQRLRRYNGDVLSDTTKVFPESLADQIATLPDSWIEQFEAIPVTTITNGAGAIVGLQIPDTIDLLNIPYTTEDINGNGVLDTGEDTNGDGALDYGRGGSRIMIDSIFGRASEIRTITRIDTAAHEIYWSEDIDDDQTFDPGEDSNSNGTLEAFPLSPAFPIGLVRVQTRERRYTWMMTVRVRPQGPSTLYNYDLAVFFRRSFNATDEQLYVNSTSTVPSFSIFGPDGLPGEGGVDDDGNGTVDDFSERDWPDTDDRTVRITWSTLPGAVVPNLRRGGYILDAGNARWYRVNEIIELGQGGGPADTASADLIVDSRIVSQGNRALVMNGVIHVFNRSFEFKKN